MHPSRPAGGGSDAADGEPAHCTIQNGDRSQTVMQVSVGTMNPVKWKDKLAQEATRGYGDCSTRYDGDPGAGYGCTYDSGVFVAGAAVPGPSAHGPRDSPELGPHPCA